MGNEKNPEHGAFKGGPEDAANLTRAFELTEASRRIRELEASVDKLEGNLLDRHAKLITIIFSCMAAFVAVCAILVTVLGYLSKSESREAARDMKSDIKEQMAIYEHRFEALAGEAMKKATLELSGSQGSLDGQVFEYNPNAPLPFCPLFVKNTGDKKTDPLSLRMLISSEVGIQSAGWERIPSNDKDYPICYYSDALTYSRTAGIGISPKETWTLSGDPSMRLWAMTTNVVNFKLQVFYGGESPAEASFTIKVSPKKP